MEFANKTAIVTGAYRGIGYAAALQLASQGANVLINDVIADGIDDVAAQIESEAKGGRVIALAGDIGSRQHVEQLVKTAIDAFGHIDILVNNAGVSLKAPLLTADDDWWDASMRINLTSMFYTCQLVGREMVKRDKGGSIINVSSIGGSHSKRNSAAYDASKGGIEALTRAVSTELAPWAIRANSIAPAAILGNYVAPKPKEWSEKRMIEKFDTPLLRQGTPEDCANLISFLASERSSFITGQCIMIDGGLSIQARAAGQRGLSITPQNVSESGIFD